MTSILQAVKKYALAGIVLLLALPVQADVLFSSTFIAPVGNSPRSVIHGDFNGDGILDIALANINSNTISVLLGNGDGSYQAAVTYATGASPYAIAQGDFNGDGKTDLAVTSYLDGSISLFFGFGDGRFSSRMDFYATAYPRGISTGDFNGDGKLDIAVTNYFDSKFSILLGTGTGYFSAPVSFTAGLGPQDIVAGDVNHDGKIDLVIVNDADSTVTIHRGNGDGTFQPTTAYGVGALPKSVALGDLNGDGFTDIMVANAEDNTVTALLGNGDASFQAARNFGVGSRPFSVKIANINGDGRPDLVVANAWGNNVSVLLGNGGTVFDPAVHFAACAFPNALAVGDANRDGKDDVAVTCGTDTILVSMVNATGVEPFGSFNGGVYYEAGAFPRAIVARDLNHDGRSDLAVVNRDGNNISVFINTGNGAFSTAVNYAVGSGPYALAADDFNQDGNIDLAVTRPGTGNVAILLGNGNGTFASASSINTGGTPYGIASIDVNNDGRVDLVMADNANNAVIVLGGNGDGTFQAAVRLAAGVSSLAITAGDFDKDGKADVAVTNWGEEGGISVLYGNGNGSFQVPVNLHTGPNPSSIISGDFNLDGNIDFATANSGDGSVSVLYSIVVGTLSHFEYYSTFTNYAGPDANFIAAGDFNTDGRPDLIVANSDTSYGSDLYLFLGGADGIFQNPVLYLSMPNGYTRSIAVGDFDNNGRPDLAVTNAFANGISVLLNTDSIPDPFVFVPLSGVSLSTLVTSNTVTITGINTAVPISIIGGEYSVSLDGGASWTGFSTTIPSVVSRGAVVRTHQTSSSNYLTTTNAVLSVGGVSGTFGVTTFGDTTPDPFTFVEQVSVPLSSIVISNAVTVMGITETSPIAIIGGEYEINNSGVWTSVNGFVKSGDQVRVRQMSSASAATTTDAVLTIGGVSDAFSVTTAAAGNGPVIEDFETGNLTRLPWTTGGSGAWTVTGTMVHGGSFAAEAPVSIGDYQSSYLEVSQSTGTGSITFWYSVSSEANYDYLRFYIDGVQQGAWSGFIGWTQQFYPVTAGVHTFRWEYSKDGSVSSGSDSVWIDDIVIPPAGSQPPAQCATAVAAGSTLQTGPSMNDLGEVVWAQGGPVNGYSQIFSNIRGQLTTEETSHAAPSINNRGDVVWERNGLIEGILDGKLTQFSFGAALYPAINDSREIVWSQYDPATGFQQIYSTKRGWLTRDTGSDHLDPSINNVGDAVWVQRDQTGRYQVYKLAVGAPQAVAMTTDMFDHGHPSINDGGEVVWTQQDGMGPGRIYSSTRGQLTFDCPNGTSHYEPSINSCGDVVFTNIENNGYVIYRLGNNSPCMTDIEPNNIIPEATVISGNTTTMGMVQDPGDQEDWYRFTANAGDTIKITVNWAPTVSPNMLMVDLMDQNGGWLANAPEPGSLKTITYTATYSGTHYVHLMALPGSRIAYNLSLKVGLGGGSCADPVSSNPTWQSASSINDLGEMVWTEFDFATGTNQVFSSTRGRLTMDPSQKEFPSVNNRGDVVWMQGGQVFGILSGQMTQLSAGFVFNGRVSINDDQEVVWVQPETMTGGGRYQIYSTKRGALVTDYSLFSNPAINNAGDVVWSQFDPASGWEQIYKLAAGSVTPVAMTSDAANHGVPSISNTGEVVWSQGIGPSDMRIYSSTRGQLTVGCPVGERHEAPSVNACGDVTFTNSVGGVGTIYRLGNNSPCMTDTEPNNIIPEATVISGNTTTMGMVQDPGDWEDWYRFTANAGDVIKVTVNWSPTASPNMLWVDLMNQYGGGLANAPEPGSPKTITYTATYTGTYYVHLMAVPGSRIAYSLSVKVGLGGGTCADPVSSNPTWQNASSMNDLGEMVWTEFDQFTGTSQVFSSTRGRLTTDQSQKDFPSVNNRGDVVWSQGNTVFGLLSGQITQLSYGPVNNGRLSINDNQEIVWSQHDPATGRYYIYSTKRGWLAKDVFVEQFNPSINNAGDVVWLQFDQMGWGQIYKLAAGSVTPIALTSDLTNHGAPWISNSGEVVWSQGDFMNMRVYSSTRGQLTVGCPVGERHEAPSVNACGDVTFTNSVGGVGTIYRLGNNSPCMTDTEPNNIIPEATVISGNTPTMGMVQDPGDWEDWYRFTANAGDVIKVTVNWSPTASPNMLMVDLMNQYGAWLANAPEPGSLKTITYTATYSGTHYVHLMALPGSRIAYNLSVKVGLGGGTCADPVSSNPTWQSASSMNDLGEMVWTEFDFATGVNQVLSSSRGRLTMDPIQKEFPSVNNRGDVVWLQGNAVYGLLSGQITQLSYGPVNNGRLSINDNQEIVWSQQDPATGRYYIYSTKRGWLAKDAFMEQFNPSINNAGDVVWSQFDPASGWEQIYKLAAGSVTPVAMTSDAANHGVPSISNTGEVVWSQGIGPSDMRIYSSTRGQLTVGCPVGERHEAPSVNACGDVTFTNSVGGVGTIYRLGNNSPCMTDTEPNNIIPEATVISGNTTTMGMVQDPGDWEDWYRFTANAGDTITVTVNWSPATPPNWLMVELASAAGVLAVASDPGSPKTITYTATYNGTYYVHLMAMPGNRIAYNLSVKVGLGGGTCADPIADAAEQRTSSINDLGEAVWSQRDPVTGRMQIHSSIRGVLTSDLNDHWNASLNNRGDVVWDQNDQVYGLIGGQLVQITDNGRLPSINDLGEVVWTRYNPSLGTAGRNQIYSSVRGLVTTDESDQSHPSLNNRGDMVWEQYDSNTGKIQIYGMINGVQTRLSPDDANMYWEPFISNSGEMVWIQADAAGSTRVYSTTRGLLTNSCPYGLGHREPSVNSCGDMTFTNNEHAGTRIYRLGNNSPCVSDAEPNNVLAEATVISANTSTLGMLDFMGDQEDWYRFTANTGDTIKIIVNWAPTVSPNLLMVDLMDENGGLLASAPEPGSPKTITTVAAFTGTYYVRLLDQNGRIGYNLALKIIDTTPPAVTIDPVATPTKINNQTISGTMEAGAAVGVSISTAAVAGPVTYPTATTWNCRITGLAEGLNDITVTAADASGNSAIATTSITVDTVAPIVTISSPVAGTSKVSTPLLTYIVDDGIVEVKVDGLSVVQRSGQNLDVLSDGTHTVRVESTDDAGNMGFAEVAFIVDTLPPTIAVNPVATPTRVNTQTIGGGRENGAIVTVSVDTSASVGSVVYPSDTTWSSTVTGLAEGINIFTITAKDAAENSATATASISYDSIAPTVSISTPLSALTNDNTPHLAYAIMDGTVSLVSVDSLTVNKTSGQDLDALADGPHTVRVEATDAAGNIGFAQVSFMVDTTPPAVAINAVSTPTNVSTQTLTGTRETNAAISVTVTTSASVGTVSYPSASTWSCTVSNLAAGDNTFTVTATDAVGNPAAAVVAITYDAIAPTVALTSPGSAPTNDNTPLLTYSVSDGSAVVKVDGVVVSKVSGDSLNTLADGSHTARVEATDAAGNTGVAQVTFTVDTVPPAISINPVTTPTRLTSQTITGTRESGLSVSVTVNTAATVGSITYPTATTWRCTISNLVRGNNVITARSVDAAGNSATATATITRK